MSTTGETTAKVFITIIIIIMIIIISIIMIIIIIMIMIMISIIKMFQLGFGQVTSGQTEGGQFTYKL